MATARHFRSPLARIPLLLVLSCLSFSFFKSEAAGPEPGSFFRLQHRYSHMDGASGRNLERGMTVEHLKVFQSHDKARHDRILADMNPSSFPVGGKADPTIAGLYFTELQLGTPPSSYYVQVDTGSDLLWINCATCKTCPVSTDLGVRLMLYDPGLSSSSSVVTCEDQFCNLTSSGDCGTGQICGYQLGYGDGSTSKGYFVKDKIQLTLLAGNRSTNATVGFGCGTQQSGGLQEQSQALDGIMGFGQSGLSVIKQLMLERKTPGIFAHCLEGESRGGGILVIGDVQAPGIVYTSIIPKQSHYNVKLNSILVSKKPMRLDVQSYTTGEKGTIIDSGTTLAYLTEQIYQPLIEAILIAGPTGLQTINSDGMSCIIFSGSLDDTFPTVTFMFDDEVAMEVKPHDYFIRAHTNTDTFWCIGFQSQSQTNLDLTILGDLVLQDRLVVYDLEKQRIGWVDYNCSSNVSVYSATGQIETVSASAIVDNSNAACQHNGEKILTLLMVVWFISALFFPL